jgi:hypothetical protein
MKNRIGPIPDVPYIAAPFHEHPTVFSTVVEDSGKSQVSDLQ